MMTKLILIFFLLAVTVEADPWYYQTDEAVEFWVPDKAQHFYGSQLMTEAGVHPLLVFVGGLLYEFWQPDFSERDLLANSLGIVAAQHRLPMAIDYSTERKEIILRIAIRLN